MTSDNWCLQEFASMVVVTKQTHNEIKCDKSLGFPKMEEKCQIQTFHQLVSRCGV